MSNSNFVPMTQEQREQAKLKRLEDQEFALNNLKIDYQDEKYWRQEASRLSLRLPNWWVAGSEVKYLRRAAKKLGLDINSFLESTGFPSLKHFAEANSRFTAFALVGLMIEYFNGRNITD